MEMNETQSLVFSMLMENTGIAMMDSGGGSGRHWQRNAAHDPRTLPEVSLDYTAPCKSDEVGITVSLYHYLPTVLELDDVCREFNTKFAKMADWDGDTYGVSKAASKWLKSKGLNIGREWNTYNGENNLSQIMQGSEVGDGGSEEGDYVLLQIHGGADVRGGYTDAKLFKHREFQSYINPVPDVWGQVVRHLPDTKTVIETVPLTMNESGYGFGAEDQSTGFAGEPVDIAEGDTIEAGLMER